MAMKIQVTDPRLRWPGAVSVQVTSEWATPWRIPYEARGLFPEPLWLRAEMPAGVRLAFRSDTREIRGYIEPQAEMSPIDLCCDGEFVVSHPLAGRESFHFQDLPPGDKQIELWLPQFGRFRLRSLELSEGASLAPYDDPRPRWITYGSSITQCRTAESPTQTWPAIVARERGFNLTCLGYGGQCHLDTMVALMIRDLPADFISMCVGINILGGASLSPRTFRPSIIGFVRILREKHPDIPLVVMSPICAPPRETTPNAVGFHLRGMREEVAAAVETLRAHGDEHVYYVNGLDILGPADAEAHLLDDGVHPNAAGYKLMGRRFLEKVIPIAFPNTPHPA